MMDEPIDSGRVNIRWRTLGVHGLGVQREWWGWPAHYIAVPNVNVKVGRRLAPLGFFIEKTMHEEEA